MIQGSNFPTASTPTPKARRSSSAPLPRSAPPSRPGLPLRGRASQGQERQEGQKGSQEGSKACTQACEGAPDCAG